MITTIPADYDLCIRVGDAIEADTLRQAVGQPLQVEHRQCVVKQVLPTRTGSGREVWDVLLAWIRD